MSEQASERERERERERDREREGLREMLFAMASFVHFLVLPDESLRLLVAADPGVFETTFDGEAQYIKRGDSDRSNGSYLLPHLFSENLSNLVDSGYGLSYM